MGARHIWLLALVPTCMTSGAREQACTIEDTTGTSLLQISGGEQAESDTPGTFEACGETWTYGEVAFWSRTPTTVSHIACASTANEQTIGICRTDNKGHNFYDICKDAPANGCEDYSGMPNNRGLWFVFCGDLIRPTPAPTPLPTSAPTASPTASPTAAPTTAPTALPTASPTTAPTASPTTAPTASPTASPTAAPTAAPTASPTMQLFHVVGDVSLQSDGTQAQVRRALLSTIAGALGVSEAEVSVAAALAGGRRLAAWAAEWRCVAEGAEAADDLLASASVMSADPSSLAESLEASFAEAGLSFDRGSLSISAPTLGAVGPTPTPTAPPTAMPTASPTAAPAAAPTASTTASPSDSLADGLANDVAVGAAKGDATAPETAPATPSSVGHADGAATAAGAPPAEEIAEGTLDGSNSDDGLWSSEDGAGVRDDPHVRDLNNERFDIRRPDLYRLLRVPHDEGLPASFELSAEMGSDGASPCGVYVKSATLSGEWLDGRTLRVRPLARNQAGTNTAGTETTSNFSLQVSGQPWRSFVRAEAGALVGEATTGRIRARFLWREQYGERAEGQALEFRLGEEAQATVTISQASHQALNVDLARLARLGEARLGGVLGTEGHDRAAEEESDECKEARYQGPVTQRWASWAYGGARSSALSASWD